MAKMEGMDVDDNAAEMLVEANGNDIRQVWGVLTGCIGLIQLDERLSTVATVQARSTAPFRRTDCRGGMGYHTTSEG